MKFLINRIKQRMLAGEYTGSGYIHNDVYRDRGDRLNSPSMILGQARNRIALWKRLI